MNFSRSLAAFAAKAKERQNQVLQGTIAEVGERLVRRTPVDEGSARAHWEASLNAPAAGPTNALDPSGITAIADINRVAAQAKIGDTAYILNAAPHIKMLEDGWSRQAPAGMVAITAAEGVSIVKDVARKVASGNGGTEE